MASTLASNSIAHEDAITALTWTSENYIVSGSLDELVRVWDPKAMDEPLFTSPTQDMAVVSLGMLSTFAYKFTFSCYLLCCFYNL